MEGTGKSWFRWVLLGVCSCAWIGLIFGFYCSGRGGISFLAGKPGTREFARLTERPDLWAEAFLAGDEAGWEWMIAEPGAGQKNGNPAQAKTLEEKVRSHGRKGIPSVWLDSVPGLLPLRRKVEADGRIAAELFACMEYPTGEDLMGHLAGVGDGTIKAVGADEWQLTWQGNPFHCQWRGATGPVSESKSMQVWGWLLVRPGMEESSRP